MGQAAKRGTPEQRKMNAEKKQLPDLNAFPAEMAKLVNRHINNGLPIPFVVATIEIIKINIANQHIKASEKLQHIASCFAPSVTVDPQEKPSAN